MNKPAIRALIATGLLSAGLLSLGVVPQEELEAGKPQLEVSRSGGSLIIDWDAHPEVFYFMEATSELTSETPWTAAKLLKDNDASGSLSWAPMITGSKGFYRLSLEGDPDAAHLREDSDGDGIINLLEAEAGWDAYAAEASTDSDADGIPDYFEQFHFGTLEHDENYVAVEGGLTMAEAFARATDPNSVDSDGDGFTEAYEIANNLDPNYNQSRDDRNLDTDDDGVSDWLEYRRGTNPLQEDSDGDGKPDAEDAVGYDAFFTFEATDESPFVVIDMGALGENEQIRAINNLGTIAVEDLNGAQIKRITLAGDLAVYDGGFVDLNNHDQLLRRVIETETYLFKTYINEALWFEDVDGAPHRAAYGITDEGKIHHERSGHRYHSQSNELYIESRALFLGDVRLTFDNGLCAVTTAINEFSGTRGNETNYYASLTDSLILSISGNDTSLVGQKLYANDVFSVYVSNGDYAIPAFSIEEDIYVIGQTFDLLFDGYRFSDETYIEAEEGELKGLARLTGQEGLWKLWYDFVSDQQALSLSGAYNGKALRDGGINEDPVIIDKIAQNGLAIAGGKLWANGRLLSKSELIGPGSVWSEIKLRKISDSGNFIAGTDEKEGQTSLLALLKVDVVAHAPTELMDGGELQKGIEIPAVDEDTPSSLQFVVNDDNDQQAAYSSTYPKDMNVADNFHQREDDLVAVTLEFPKEIDTGTLEISANVDSSDPEARAYIVTSGGMSKPTKELVTLAPATSIDLSSASNTDLLWELADQGEQTLYIEGLAAKSDLEVKLTFKVNGTEMASESVHMEILPSTERTLKVLAYSGMGGRAMVHMNNSDNVLRKDHDGYKDTKDRVTPIAFRQDGAASSQGIDNSWRIVNSSNTFQTSAIYDELTQQGHDVYICEDIYPAAGQARLGEGVRILGKAWPQGSTPKGTLAHEWLHAFSSHNHVNETDDIMWGNGPPPANVDTNNNGILDGNESMVECGHGGNVSEHQYNHFIN